MRTPWSLSLYTTRSESRPAITSSTSVRNPNFWWTFFSIEFSLSDWENFLIDQCIDGLIDWLMDPDWFLYWCTSSWLFECLVGFFNVLVVLLCIVIYCKGIFFFFFQWILPPWSWTRRSDSRISSLWVACFTLGVSCLLNIPYIYIVFGAMFLECCQIEAPQDANLRGSS